MAVRDMVVGVHVGLCLDGEVQVGSREGGVVECVAMQGVVWSGVEWCDAGWDQSTTECVLSRRHCDREGASVGGGCEPEHGPIGEWEVLCEWCGVRYG